MVELTPEEIDVMHVEEELERRPSAIPQLNDNEGHSIFIICNWN